MKIIRNGGQGNLARLAQNAPGQSPVEEKAEVQEESSILPVANRPKGNYQVQRSYETRDNDSIQEVIAKAGEKLGYGCNVQVQERMDGPNSHYSIYMSKVVKNNSSPSMSAEGNLLRLKFDIPSYGLVRGDFEDGPDWINPQQKLALIRDVMKVAMASGEIAALPMKQNINLNAAVTKQLNIPQQMAGKLSPGGNDARTT